MYEVFEKNNNKNLQSWINFFTECVEVFISTVLKDRRYVPRYVSQIYTHLTFTCSKSIIETLKKGVKYVPS